MAFMLEKKEHEKAVKESFIYILISMRKQEREVFIY
jgi:hypothetical protein